MHHGAYPWDLLPPASEGLGKILFSACLSVHTSTGGGYPLSQVWMVEGDTLARSGWWGGTPARSGWGGGTQPGLDGGRRVLQPGLDGGWGRLPQPGLDGGGYPSQVWMVGGVPQPGLDRGGYPPARSGWWGGTLARSGWVRTPQPGLDGGGGGYSSQVWMVAERGYPSQVWMVGCAPARSGWLVGYPSQVWIVGGTPQPGLDGGGVPWDTLPSQV